MKKNTSKILIPLFVFIIAAYFIKTTEAAQAPSTAGQPATAGYKGAVVESLNAAGYTYVLVDTGSEKIWAAATEFQVKVGDKVKVPPGSLMKNFHSKTLNRTFDLIYFVGKITVDGAEQTSNRLPSGHPGIAKAPPATSGPAEFDFSGIEKPEGGKTIADIYAEKSKLSGKNVLLRGKVVKFNPNIMGKNWMHLQDGTGAAETNDLTITTSENVKVGDKVLVSGVIVTEKDFGAGYKFAVMIEAAEVTVE